MPTRPLRPCSEPGCPELSSQRLCLQHRREMEHRRGNSNQRGYTVRWRRYRKVFLQRNPLCCECRRNGRLTVATEVDHIIPHKGDRELFWDTKNHQALCKSCHSSKTIRETTF